MKPVPPTMSEHWYGYGVAVLGIVLSTVHLGHIQHESSFVAKFIGGHIPLLLSIGLFFIGIWLVTREQNGQSTRRIVAWLGLGMGWMSVAGTGAIIYEVAQSRTIDHALFLGVVFATYGAIPGFVTGLYDAQRLLRRSALETRERAMASAIDGMAILDEDDRITYLNQAFSGMFGYDDPAALQGTRWESLYSDEEQERFQREIFPALQADGSWRGRATGTRKDGTTYPQRLSLTELPDGGWIWIVRDISDQVDRELAFSVLNRVLRHNLSNEINVVVGQAERIRSRSSGPVADAAARIEETGFSLAGLAEKERQIADLVLRDPEPTSMALESTLTPAVAAVKQRFPEAAIEVTNASDVAVQAIPELQPALEELIENAIVHTDDPEAWAGVDVDVGDETVDVTVNDAGPGIPEQDRKVVSGKQDIDALFHGSGLGLWYVYWVMRNLGGSVSFADRNPEGSAVTLSLPLAEAACAG